GSQYGKELVKYTEMHPIEPIVPATQFDLRFLSDRKTFFMQHLNCKVAVPDTKFLDVFLDKKKTHRFLGDRGFPIQQEQCPENGGKFPLIGKPLNGWGSK